MLLFKYRLLVVCYLSFIFVLASSQSVQVGESTIDLGEIYRNDGPVHYTGIIENYDTVPINILNAELFVNNVEINFENKKLLPGKNTNFHVVLDPLNAREYLHNKITLYFDNRPPIVLTVLGIIIDGTLKEAVNYQIGNLGLISNQMNFGFIYKGEMITKKFPVLNLSDQPINIEIVGLPGHIEVLVNPVVLKPNEKSFIEVTYKTDKINNWDITINDLLLKVKGKETAEKKILVIANIREDFRKLDDYEKENKPSAHIVTNNYNFDTIKAGQLVTHPFVLRNTGASDLIIRTIHPSCAFYEVVPEKMIIPPGDTSVIRVTLDTEGLKGYKESGVTIITNDPANYKQFLWMNGVVN